MSKLEKAVYTVYVFIAIMIGGMGAYCTVTFGDVISSKLMDNEETNEDDLKANGQVINVDSNLCIRNEPSMDAEVDYALYQGMTFKILGKENEWYKIDYNNVIGYVYEEYVDEYDDVPNNPTYEEIESSIILNSLNNMQIPIKVELTAYCNCAICSEEWGSKTAMQTHTRIGVVAAPTEITLGSRLYIPDLKEYKDDCVFDVEDRGGAVQVKDDGTYIIDVWLPTHEEVKEFGRKKSTVFLIQNQ